MFFCRRKNQQRGILGLARGMIGEFLIVVNNCSKKLRK
ncbi:hypothetical protein RV03_GL001265 [Enterococcus gallinarum]|nr:hypothetical protein RV03_GL001265 [Enterococcus gallinarum]